MCYRKAQMAETIIGTIPNVTDTKLFSRKNYNLIFTTDRLIGSLVTPISLKSSIMRTLGKDHTITSTHKINSSPISEIDYVKRYEQMQVNEIVNEMPDNFSVAHNHIVKIVFKTNPKDKMTVTTAHPQISYYSWYIEIKSMLINIKLKSASSSHPQIISIKDVISNIYGERIQFEGLK